MAISWPCIVRRKCAIGRSSWRAWRTKSPSSATSRMVRSCGCYPRTPTSNPSASTSRKTRSSSKGWWWESCGEAKLWPPELNVRRASAALRVARERLEIGFKNEKSHWQFRSQPAAVVEYGSVGGRHVGPHAAHQEIQRRPFRFGARADVVRRDPHQGFGRLR